MENGRAQNLVLFCQQKDATWWQNFQVASFVNIDSDFLSISPIAVRQRSLYRPSTA